MADSNFINNASALGSMNDSNIANLTAAGGQYGPGPIFTSLSASSPLVLPRAFICVIETPRMYDNNLAFAYLIKTLMESCAKSVSGIDLNYNTNFNSVEMGRDSQTMETPAKTVRVQPSPTFVWPEYIGNVVWNTMYKWTTDMQDPDTNAVGVKTTMDRDDYFDYRFYGATMFVMQPDTTFQARRLINSYIITNVAPKTTGELGVKVEMTDAPSPERSINFSGFQIHNKDTVEMGKILWQTLQLEGVNYKNLTNGIGAINSNIKNAGIFRDISDVIAATS